MSKLFESNLNVPEYQKLENRYKGSINNLLFVVVASVINIVLLVLNTDLYFLFSAFIPYALADYGMYFCGLYPEEYYVDMQDFAFYDTSFMGIMLTAAAVVIGIYLLCWYFAKKKKIGGIVFALIFFIIDTVAMLWYTGFSMDIIIDVIFHIGVIGYLINAIIVYKKLKKTPEIQATTEIGSEGQDYPSVPQNLEILRMADPDVKSRTLLEAETFGHRIVYRRVKTTNELVIDGRVYDEYIALIEVPHNLVAEIDGHTFEAGMMNPFWSYIKADGEILIKKVRLI